MPGAYSTDIGAYIIIMACGVWGRFSLLRQQMRKAATNAIGGKPVGRGRSRTDRRSSGEITVFPALALQNTKQYNVTTYGAGTVGAAKRLAPT